MRPNGTLFDCDENMQVHWTWSIPILSAEVPRADLARDVGGPVEDLTDAAVVSYAPICIHVQGILNACTRLEVKRS
jgi:hypothetical protein